MNYILEGNIAVKAAIQANKRTIHKLLVEARSIQKKKDTRYIVKLAKQKNIPVQICEKETIAQLAQGTTHGGLLAICSKLEFLSLAQLPQSNSCYYVILEGIEDPFNFGHMLRSLYASGCDGIILLDRNWDPVFSTIAKASAGASEYLPIAAVSSMQEVVDFCTKKQIPILCALRNAQATSLYHYQFPNQFALAIGGEMRGLSKIIQKASTQNIYIPYANNFKNAMSASACASIFGFEIMRQKNIHQ